MNNLRLSDRELELTLQAIDKTGGLMVEANDELAVDEYRRLAQVIQEGPRRLDNKAMQRSLDVAECIDLANTPRLGKYYILEKYEDNVDYCDAATESWVWSIGKLEVAQVLCIWGDTYTPPTSKKATGTWVKADAGLILASLQSDLYQRDGVECLWLR